MILEVGIANLSQLLDKLSPCNKQNISSNTKPKENVLKCLTELLNKASTTEFANLVSKNKKNYLLGYLMKLLCELIRHDSSKNIKLHSFQVMQIVLNKLERLETEMTIGVTQSIGFSWLPGVTSTIFKFIMSDTKLPTNLLTISIQTLSQIIRISYHCDEKKRFKEIDEIELEDTCQQLSIRFNFLINYMIMNSNCFSSEINLEILYLCQYIATETTMELTSYVFKPVIRFIAFISSQEQAIKVHEASIDEIISKLKERLLSCDDKTVELDMTILKNIMDLVDNLEDNFKTMLPAERSSELGLFNGYLKLIPFTYIDTIFEIRERGEKLLQLFIDISEFSTRQPMLLLTETMIDQVALETCGTNVYTIEKRFSYLSGPEIRLLKDSCRILGQELKLDLLQDLLQRKILNSKSPNEFFVFHLLLHGCPLRSDLEKTSVRFILTLVRHYLDQINFFNQQLKESDENSHSSYSKTVLMIVICIETLVTIAQLNIRVSRNDVERLAFLRYTLCEILNCAASDHRAISESSISFFFKVAKIYNFSSTKDLLENNIDYIIDGAMHKLDHFILNTEVTNVIALTFKLTTVDNFYYFKDVYEKVFKTLDCHYYDKSQPIAMLFYRTISILNERKVVDSDYKLPFSDEKSIKDILYKISIDRRIEKLKNLSNERLDEDYHQVSKEDENEVREELEAMNKSGKMPEFCKERNGETSTSTENEQQQQIPKEIHFIEKILTYCIHLMSSNNSKTKILALKTATCGFRVLSDYEDILLPLSHKIWTPLYSRLTCDYHNNLEVNLCAFECLLSMSEYTRDFIKKRTLANIVPKMCMLLKSLANSSRGQKDYSPFCMTLDYKCQLRVLESLGRLAYNIQLAYDSLWPLIEICLLYMDENQPLSLRNAAKTSLYYLMVIDADSVWYFAKFKQQYINDLPFKLIYKNPKRQ